MEVQALRFLFDFLRAWWWLLLPFLLFRPFLYLWVWWRQEVFAEKNPSIILELKAPPEVAQPMKAMESVFAGLWQLYDPPNPREKWFEGKYQFSIALEIVSIEGEVHFYLRCPKGARKLVESAIYAQYPDAEISEAEDYTKNVPQNIPNKEWELWGCNYYPVKPDVYPIKTYSQFFEERSEIEEEKKIDPMSLLVEGLSKLGKGEQIWIQFILWPITTAQYDFVKAGRAIVDTLVHRPKPPKPTTLLEDLSAAGTLLATGKAPAEKAKEVQELIPPEMKLTPGEREVVAAIERKISKYAFLATIRFINVAKRESYFSPTKALVFSYFTQFATNDLNALVPFKPTITKVHTISTWFLDKRRVFLRKRRLFRNYINRVPPFFPNFEYRFLLNVEELATMFHFPGRITTPTVAVPRVEAKKGEAPPELPTE